MPARRVPAIGGWLAWWVAALSAGCGVPPVQPLGALVVADGASVAVFGRSIGDMIYSGATGRDCSVVRLDRGKSYCRAPEAAVVSQPFCTRSLGAVDCWATPDIAPPHSREVADGPRALTPEQLRNAQHAWPDL